MENLFTNSLNLKNQAHKLLEQWSLVQYLKQYGRAYIVGSVDLNLMVWPDIDIEVECERDPSKDAAADISRYLFVDLGFRKTSQIDYRDSDGVKKPKGIYTGGEYILNGAKWELDIWLMESFNARTRKYTEKIKMALTPEFREIILELKNKFFTDPRYKKQITSYDIYNAVINHNIQNLTEFEAFVKNEIN